MSNPDHLANTLGLAICCEFCAAKPEFVAEFDRLTGSDLAQMGAPINVMIDHATGKFDADAAKFIDFVRETVWERLDPEVRRELVLGREDVRPTPKEDAT